MKTAEEYYQSKSGGKSSTDSTNDEEYMAPMLAVILMEEYAQERTKDMYPKEFVNYLWSFADEYFYKQTLDKVYGIWQKEIRDKREQ